MEKEKELIILDAKEVESEIEEKVRTNLEDLASSYRISTTLLEINHYNPTAYLDLLIEHIQENIQQSIESVIQTHVSTNANNEQVEYINFLIDSTSLKTSLIDIVMETFNTLTLVDLFYKKYMDYYEYRLTNESLVNIVRNSDEKDK